jgi:hypothetical protein
MSNSLILRKYALNPDLSESSSKEKLEIAEKLAEIDYEGHLHKLNYAQITSQLHKANCPPFTQQSIIFYKTWMMLKARGFRRALTVSILAAALFVAFISEVDHSASALTVIFTLLAFIGCGILTGVFWTAFASVQARWETCRLGAHGAHGGVIPDEVAEKILRIKEVIPDVSFSVDELLVTKREKVVDPFLIAIVDGYIFHVAVWDEPEYIPMIKKRESRFEERSRSSKW